MVFRSRSLTIANSDLLEVDWGLRVFPQVGGSHDGKDAIVATRQQQPSQKPGSLIVEKIFVPVVLNKLWNNDDNPAVWMLFGQFEDDLDDRHDYKAVRRGQNRKLGRLLSRRAKRL